VGPCLNARGLISAAKQGPPTPTHPLAIIFDPVQCSPSIPDSYSSLGGAAHRIGALVNNAGITSRQHSRMDRTTSRVRHGRWIGELAVGNNPGWYTAGRVWPAAARLARGEGKTVGAAAEDPDLDAGRVRFGSRLPWLRAMTMSGEPQPTAQQLDGGYRPGAAGPFGR
jgi:hypothetical protein